MPRSCLLAGLTGRNMKSMEDKIGKMEEMQRAALEPGEYTGFTGWICYGHTDAYVEDANFTIEDVHIDQRGKMYMVLGTKDLITFRKGRFIGGRLGFCVWIDGVFSNGMTLYTIWRKGTWENGVFNGIWFGGNWIAGSRRIAYFKPGMLVDWHDYTVDQLLELSRDIRE